MYETRHTFASWALAAGESPEWVARTLGHVNTSMVFKTYGRYIPNLTRQDGSAFERQFNEEVLQGDGAAESDLGTILGTIADFVPRTGVN
jgi:integrase